VQKLVTETDTRRPMRETHLDVEIASVATANPQHKVAQADAIAHAKRIFPHFDRLEALFGNTGIEWRYTCQPLSWCHERHGWTERNAEFQRHALDLLAPLATEAVAKADLELADIDMLVVNTITGLAVPSLDALLLSRIALPETVERLPIFGYGCGGGVAGLARTAQLAASQPGTNALFLTIELCSLCARPNNPSLTAFVSGALFGDGAGAVVLKSPKRGAGINSTRPAIRAVGEHCWRKTEHLLGYTIRDDGFGMVLSPELPAVMRERLGPAIDEFLARNSMSRNDMAGYLFHPGGRKILESAAEIPGPGQDGLEHSWAVLRDFGNMSSASILFVLDRAMRSGARGRHLLSAFGPGFSTYFIVADL
jgi:alkylresorcinol/alkylpyrone synthase